VNWFRKDDADKFLWPGFGENSRVLKWIFERIEGEGEAGGRSTPIGMVPAESDLDLSDLDFDAESWAELMEINPDAWRKEAAGIAEYYAQFGDHLPNALQDELKKLQQRLAE
jgi:phosphoenolpyruvate carboxykinase (GTP)